MAVYQKKTIPAQEQAEESELSTLGVRGGFQVVYVIHTGLGTVSSRTSLINIRQESFHSM